ncbi:PREDICTED: uncharacterized protein LOC108558151 [Nicrophorus vespilloides]|uniref:Uncharacterized protein LOC108558151 n=1 Tax=Nicrophorus vespilloides TaxID=110193 RepID=A0ABM1M7B0_NICVS|nr:PREDICTED: uncharacterized protein LOC108558151 [Nicrophorus vespilloides]XP_017770461.1 PREDICTED: uncharacterized protein LOC108558151 [Nicrophorus vespilloides]XP_017770462.1 PREDICTED: uncharacterized protein LOC108558151 [Nicrophorus vespilloides]
MNETMDDEKLKTDQSRNVYLLIRFEDEDCGYPDFITIGKQIRVKDLTYEREATIVSVYENYDKLVESISYCKNKVIKEELMEEIYYDSQVHMETTEKDEQERIKDNQNTNLQDEEIEESQIEHSQVLLNNCDIDSKFDIEYNGVNVDVSSLLKVKDNLDESSEVQISDNVDSSAVVKVSNNVDESLLVKVKDEIFVTLPPNNSQVPRNIYKSINWDNYREATEGLLKSLFNKRTLATRTMTGMKRQGHRYCNKLDPEKIEDIIQCVTSKCNTQSPLVRRAITKICYKAKLSCKINLKTFYRNKQKFHLKGSNLMVQFQDDSVLFGPNKTRMSKDIFNSIDWSRFAKAVESILSCLYSSDVLVTNYLNTDKRSNPPELDPKKVEDILYIVNKKSGRDKAHIRFALRKKWSSFFQASPGTEPVTKDPDMSRNIFIGPNNSKMKKEIFELINWRDYAAATRSLHYALIGGGQSTTQTRRSISFEDIPRENESETYDKKIEDIIHIVTEKCVVTKNKVKDVLYNNAAGRPSRKIQKKRY